MQTDTIENALIQAEQEHKQKLQAVEDEHHKKIQGLINSAKLKFADALKVAVDRFNIIPADFRQDVLTETGIVSLLKPLMITSKKSRANLSGTTRPRRPKVSDEAILAALSSEMIGRAVAAKLGINEALIGKRLEKLQASGKVTMRPEGRSKFWKRS